MMHLFAEIFWTRKPVRSKAILLASALAVALSRSACGAPADQPATLQLLPEAQVDSTGIFLHQIIITYDPSVALPQLRLASAPGLGQTARLSRSQITELVQKYEPSGLPTTNWSGALEVRVTRRTRQLVDSDMTQLLAATLQRESVKDKGELELQFTRPWIPVTVPDEPLTVKVIDLPATGVNPSFVVRFEIWNGREHVGSWQQPVLARIWRDIPIAHSSLTRGGLLRDADISFERHDLLVQREAFLSFTNADSSLELAENIPAGLPILNRSLRQRPAIRRGRLVEGVFQEGSLSISLKVETLEDGLPGQIIRVRNPKTKREIYGKVQNEQTVQITL